MVASKASRKSARKKAAPEAARVKLPARAAAGKAVVLNRFTAANGKVYQVLAPAAGPKHLSSEDVERAVELMVAAR